VAAGEAAIPASTTVALAAETGIRALQAVSAQQTPPTQQTPALALDLPALPSGVAGQAYHVKLSARGGVPPLFWEVVEGNLPPGLQLDSDSGFIFGVPSTTGDFRLVVSVTDSSAAVARDEIAVHINPALAIQWEPPQVQDTTISGRLTVMNNTSDSLQATVIVVAVNEIGKAFVLGYEQLSLAPRSQGGPVLFASTLPFGSYVVHADTIADIPSTQFIYRAHLQSQPMTISPPF
jgi:hypothetical protein